MRTALASTALTVSLLASAPANALVNGSFEDGGFLPPSNQTMTLNPGSGALTGWEVLADSIAWIGTGDPWGLDAQEGARFLDLSDYSAGRPFGGVAQTFATTPGWTYTVDFQLGSSNAWGRPAALTVSAAAASQNYTSATTGTANDWQAETFVFVATAATTTLSFVGASGVNYIGLDNVAVSAVPEPASALLMLGGALAVGAYGRRRGALRGVTASRSR